MGVAVAVGVGVDVGVSVGVSVGVKVGVLVGAGVSVTAVVGSMLTDFSDVQAVILAERSNIAKKISRDNRFINLPNCPGIVAYSKPAS